MNEVEIRLLKEIEKAIKQSEVPVASVIVNKGRIIASSHNKKEKLRDPLAHAEIICIKKAAKKMKSWNLSDCELYVTLHPCRMCEDVINEARIKKVYYYLEREKNVNNNIIYTKISNKLCVELKNELTDFFKNIR